eukprot:2720994-Amphidinium_carterae.1
MRACMRMQLLTTPSTTFALPAGLHTTCCVIFCYASVQCLYYRGIRRERWEDEPTAMDQSTPITDGQLEISLEAAQ